MFLDKRVFVSILAPDASNNDQEDYIAHPGFVGGVLMNIQPASPMFTSLNEGVQGKMFRGFTTASGIVETHRITVSGTGEIYTVQGREKYDYGMGQHYELTLVKPER